MTFQFIVETGTADPAANSYVELAYADDYISTNSFTSATWAALDDDTKEKFLVRSTKYIDRLMRWNGNRVDSESGLRWPRCGVYDADGFEIPDTMIPVVLQDAVCEFASYLAGGEDWTSPSGTRGMKEIKIDVVELVFDTEMTRASLPDFVIEMLTDLGSVTRGTRPGFKRINRK